MSELYPQVLSVGLYSYCLYGYGPYSYGPRLYLQVPFVGLYSLYSYAVILMAYHQANRVAAWINMTYVLMAHGSTRRFTLSCCIVMASAVTANTVMAYRVMVHAVMAHGSSACRCSLAAAHIVVANIVMASILMARRCSLSAV